MNNGSITETTKFDERVSGATFRRFLKKSTIKVQFHSDFSVTYKGYSLTFAKEPFNIEGENLKTRYKYSKIIIRLKIIDKFFTSLIID